MDGYGQNLFICWTVMYFVLIELPSDPGQIWSPGQILHPRGTFAFSLLYFRFRHKDEEVKPNILRFVCR